MTVSSQDPIDQAVGVFDRQYRDRGMRSQRTYPNESLIQFLASRYFHRSAADRKAIRVLEVGCGSGANLWMIAKEGFDAYGIDSSREGIALAQNHLKEKWNVAADLRVGSMIELPYPDAYFDAVVDVVSLQHLCLTDSVKALTEIGRVLKPVGAFFSYRLSDHSVMCAAGARIDSATLADISDPSMPLAGNGPTSFWSPVLARQMYCRAGLAIDSVERVGRTYANGMFVEYLNVVGAKGSSVTAEL
jgi:SAM-dependent methyltransferase